MEDTDKPVGRPSSYKPEFAAQAEKICRLGATDRELAAIFSVAESTIYQWKLQFPEFSQALKRGKDECDNLVEVSLFRRATGYSFDSEKIFCNKDVGVVRVDCVEHVPPDVTACIFWLKNRRSQEWRDVHKVEHSGKVTLEDLILGRQPSDAIPASPRAN